MEVYFKELISKEASVEKLVEDLERVVQGADDLAKSIGLNLAEPATTEIGRRLNHLKESCQRLKLDIVEQARATDRLVRQNPYPFMFGAVVVGMLVGARVSARK